MPTGDKNATSPFAGGQSGGMLRGNGTYDVNQEFRAP
jgi:hypothetical protein